MARSAKHTMRIAILSKTYVAETAQRQLEWLARQPDVDLTLITPEVWRADDGGTMPFQPTFTAGYRCVPTKVALNGHYHLYHYPNLRRILDELRPNLLHIDEEPYNTATFQAVRLARERHIPTIVVAWQNLVRRYPPPFAWMEQSVYRHAAAIIAGNAGAAEVVRAKGYRGELATFSLHGIDPEIWPPRMTPPPTPDVPFTLGYIGRLVPEKGIDTLLNALALLPPRVRLCVIGRGPAAAQLHQQACTLGLTDRVRWREQIPSIAIPAAMRELDCLVLPSRRRPNWTEQFGRVLAEAMVSGIPVIGSDVGEIPRVIADAGIVVPEGKPNLLAASIAALANNPVWWAELAARGRARALAHFTQAAIAERLAALYREILRE